MASWAKNQIAKQLAKFAKNLDPSSLSLKFFKGEGELTNLELDESMLSDLLEFPPWLQLTKVTCNRITAKVPWTSLKSDPIRLMLDCVEVQIVASETAREKASNVPAFANKANVKPTKYGFSEKVVDGMYISINTLMASFTSLGFKASVNVTRIIVQSTTPDWKQTKNLRHTRIKDDNCGEVLIFKEIKWGTMRLDADAAYKPESKDIPSTPLRLITNNSAIQLVIKKRLSDSSMISSKLAVILDDILWVLTRSQLLKLSSFIHYLIKLRSKYLPITHQSAAQNKPEVNLPSSTGQGLSQDQVFKAYDLAETSIHLHTHRIDLHLCDDSALEGNQKPNSGKKGMFNESGAALQISLMNIALDHCPYHISGRKRIVVKSDTEVAYQRQRWAHQLMNNFQETEGKQWTPGKNNFSARGKKRPTMYESFFVVNCENFQIMKVTTSGSLQPKPFLSSEKEALFLPKEMAAMHVDHTTYYYPTSDLPVPTPNVYVQVNPIQLTFDPLTCVWLNRFAQSVMTGLDWTKEFMSHDSGFIEHVNVRVEALMPKIVIPITNDTSLPHLEERPSHMQIQISQAVVSNCRVGSKSSQADLLSDLQNFIGCRHYADLSCFPNIETDYSPYSNSAWLHDFSINYHQLQNLTRRDKDLYYRLKRDKNLPHQIWCVCCDQLWIDFMGIGKANGRPVTFVDAIPFRLWICQDVPYYSSHSQRPISPVSTSSSVSSIETGEVATELDMPRDIKLNEDQVVYNAQCNNSTRIYDSNQSDLLRHDLTPNGPTAFSHKRNVSSGSNVSTHSEPTVSVPRCGSTHSLNEKPLYIPKSVNQRLYSPKQSRSKFYHDEEEHSNSNHLHISHSDGDLLSCDKNGKSEDLNCAHGGPPPPYSPINEYNNSITSLPPAYDALSDVSDDPGPINKPSVPEAFDYSVESEQEPATMALLLNISKTVQVQIDHFQMLFLIRLGEVVTNMMERIASDNEVCDEERKVSLNQWSEVEQIVKQDESLVMNITIPNVLVDIVLAPCIGIDPIQRLSLPDRVQYDKERAQVNNATLEFPPCNEDYFLPERKKSISQNSTPQRADSVASSTVDTNVSPVDSNIEVSFTKCLSNYSDQIVSSQPISYDKQVEDQLKPEINQSEGKYEDLKSDSPDYFQTDDNSGGNLDFDDTLKEVRDMEVQVGQSLVRANLKPKPENQLLSVLRIHAGSVTVGMQAVGKDNAIKVAADTLELNELGNIKYGKLLDPRGTILKEKNKDKQNVNMIALTGDGMVQLRLVTGPKAEHFAKGGAELGFADIRVSSLAAALLMSTIDNLTEFAEDEFVLPTMPFVVSITHSDVSLYDDKLRCYKSAIKLPPMQVVLDEMYIERDTNGIITIKQQSKNEQQTVHNDGSQKMTDVATSYNSSFNSPSVNSTLIAESINKQVDALIGENGRLLEDLKVVNAKVNGLHGERESLLKVIDKLQVELMMSNRENDDLQTRIRSLSLSKHKGNFV